MATIRTLSTSHAALVSLAFVSLGAVVCVLGGCVESMSASHVRAGDLYAPGEDRYDDYFAEVHSQQATAAQWPDDRKAARQPLMTALKIDGDTTDAAIEQSTRTVKPGAQARALGPVIEQTIHADGDRAKNLEALAAKIDGLVKTGHDLEGHVSEDFRAPRGQTASQVKGELHASYYVLANIKDRAKREAKAAEAFVTELQRSLLGTKRAASVKGGSGSSGATKPPPKPTGTGEVFQP